MINAENMSKAELITALESFVSAATENYHEAGAEAKDDAFQAGRQLAYYEMLDILRSRIIVNNGEMDDIETPV